MVYNPDKESEEETAVADSGGNVIDDENIVSSDMPEKKDPTRLDIKAEEAEKTAKKQKRTVGFNLSGGNALDEFFNLSDDRMVDLPEPWGKGEYHILDSMHLFVPWTWDSFFEEPGQKIGLKASVLDVWEEDGKFFGYVHSREDEQCFITLELGNDHDVYAINLDASWKEGLYYLNPAHAIPGKMQSDDDLLQEALHSFLYSGKPAKITDINDEDPLNVKGMLHYEQHRLEVPLFSAQQYKVYFLPEDHEFVDGNYMLISHKDRPDYSGINMCFFYQYKNMCAKRTVQVKDLKLKFNEGVDIPKDLTDWGKYLTKEAQLIGIFKMPNQDVLRLECSTHASLRKEYHADMKFNPYHDVSIPGTVYVAPSAMLPWGPHFHIQVEKEGPEKENDQSKIHEAEWKYDGVRFLREKSKWEAFLVHGEETYNLGDNFETALEAAKAVNRKCDELEIPIQNPVFDYAITDSNQPKNAGHHEANQAPSPVQGQDRQNAYAFFRVNVRNLSPDEINSGKPNYKQCGVYAPEAEWIQCYTFETGARVREKANPENLGTVVNFNLGYVVEYTDGSYAYYRDQSDYELFQWGSGGLAKRGTTKYGRDGHWAEDILKTLDEWHFLLWVNVVIQYVDQGTDIAVAVTYADEENYGWFTLALILIVGPNLMIAFFGYMISDQNKWIALLTFLGFLPILNIYEVYAGHDVSVGPDFKKWAKDEITQRLHFQKTMQRMREERIPPQLIKRMGFDSHTTNERRHMMAQNIVGEGFIDTIFDAELRDTFYAINSKTYRRLRAENISAQLVTLCLTMVKLIEALAEAVPQSILQSYVLMNKTTYSGLEVASIMVSCLSIAIAASKTMNVLRSHRPNHTLSIC